jgi:parvulin-like peptidyl-prolyl isomerase
MGRILLTLALGLVGAAGLAAQTPAGKAPPQSPAAPGKAETYVSAVSANIPAAADKPAAMVNGEMISMLEVKALLETRPYPNTLKADEIKACRQAAVDLLVEDMLIRQFLTKYAPAVTQTDVTKELQILQDHLKKDNKTLADLVKETGQTMEQLQKDVVARLQWRGYLQNRLKEDEARKYYEANKPFFDKIMVRASHVLVKVPPNATAEQKKVLLNRAETIRQEVVGGKMTFEAAVKQYSECPSKDNKKEAPGDLGLFPFKFVVVEPFAKAAFAMKIGAVSGIVTTDFGYHIIKVTDRTQPKEGSTYEAVRDAVREIWAQDVELYQQIIGHQKKNSKIEVFLQ